MTPLFKRCVGMSDDIRTYVKPQGFPMDSQGIWLVLSSWPDDRSRVADDRPLPLPHPILLDKLFS